MRRDRHSCSYPLLLKPTKIQTARDCWEHDALEASTDQHHVDIIRAKFFLRTIHQNLTWMAL